MDDEPENLPVRDGFRPSGWAVAQRCAPAGFAASFVIHLGAIGLVSAVASTVQVAITAFGNSRPLSISATFSEQAEPTAAREESGAEQIVVMPTEVWQDNRRFVSTIAPTTDRAVELAAKTVPQPALDQAAPTRPTDTPQPDTVRPDVARRETTARRRPAASSEPALAPINLPPPDIRFIGRPCRYPEVAEQAGWEGTVELLITIAADGTITDVAIYKSSGNGAADAEAVQAARDWLAVPTKRNGKLWPATFLKPIIFRL